MSFTIVHRVLCFHLGMTERFIWNYDESKRKIVTTEETQQLIEEIHNEITVKNRNLIYKHEWKPGKFIISDNSAVGHEAAPETQYSRDQEGLCVLHRTTIRGVHKPEK